MDIQIKWSGLIGYPILKFSAQSNVSKLCMILYDFLLTFLRSKIFFKISMPISLPINATFLVVFMQIYCLIHAAKTRKELTMFAFFNLKIANLRCVVNCKLDFIFFECLEKPRQYVYFIIFWTKTRKWIFLKWLFDINLICF